jgi:hypothetical protein
MLDSYIQQSHTNIASTVKHQTFIQAKGWQPWGMMSRINGNQILPTNCVSKTKEFGILCYTTALFNNYLFQLPSPWSSRVSSSHVPGVLGSPAPMSLEFLGLQLPCPWSSWVSSSHTSLEFLGLQLPRHRVNQLSHGGLCLSKVFD